MEAYQQTASSLKILVLILIVMEDTHGGSS